MAKLIVLTYTENYYRPDSYPGSDWHLPEAQNIAISATLSPLHESNAVNPQIALVVKLPKRLYGTREQGKVGRKTQRQN